MISMIVCVFVMCARVCVYGIIGIEMDKEQGIWDRDNFTSL